MNSTAKKVFDILDKIFSSHYLTPIVFCLAFIFYFTKLTALSVCLFAITIVFILCFCKNVKNIFSLVFYMPFFINDIYSDPKWVVYGIAIGLACLSFLLFFIKSLILNKNQVSMGKLFYPLIIADIAFLLGGVIGFFSLRLFFINLGFSVAVYLLYFIALNFTKGLKEHLFFIFVVGALFIVLQMIILKATNEYGDFLTDIIWIGSQNINAATLFVLLGIVGCFGLGLEKKYDYLTYIVAILICVGLFIMHCRMTMLLAGILMAIFTVYMFIKSPNKTIFLSVLLALAVLFIVTYFIFRERIHEYINTYLEKDFGGTSGRLALWTWCLARFDENVLFGVGFVAKNDIPSLANNPNHVISAHNTPIQWLTSLGLIGSFLMMIFYLGKYKTALGNFNKSTLMLLVAILAIEASGLMDQAAAVDIFVYLISLILVCAIEKEPKREGEKFFCRDDFRFIRKAQIVSDDDIEQIEEGSKDETI